MGSSLQKLKGVAILGVVAALVLPASAAGERTSVPPGSTEGDQYTEVVPNGGGSGTVEKGGGGGGASGAGQVVPATQALNALGPQGQAAADLANSNPPPQEVKQRQQVKQGQGKQPKPEPSSSTEGEGGMGFPFLLLLVLTALAAIAYGVRRRLTPA